MVCTRCMTYNHESYIRDALQGFILQQTEFPVVFVVVDDASTDKTVEVIREFVYNNFDLEDNTIAYEKETNYAQIIFARHKSSINCYFAVLLLKENHYSQKKSKAPYIAEWMIHSKYHSICEGDDYWTDPLKLQKQVDFLETHPEHTLCFHAVNNLYPNGLTKLSSRYNADVEECPIEDFFKIGGAFAPTCSMLYVNGKLEPPPSFRKISTVGDSPMILTLFLRGKVGFLSDVMGCYRVNAIGSWSQRQKELSFRRIVEKCRRGLAYWNEVNRYTNGKYSKCIRRRKFHTLLSLVKSLCTLIRNMIVAQKK